MLETLIIILVVLWLIGYLGPTRFPRIPSTGNWVHVLIIIVVILVIVRVIS